MKTESTTKNGAGQFATQTPSAGAVSECEKNIKELCKRHNALARYVGVPCCIEPEKITRYPAVLEEHGALCRGFGGYRVPLAAFKGHFNRVRFRGMGNGKHVVCGYVVDKDGYVESFARMPESDDGWAVLPLTPDSHALFASVPLKKGKPVWKDITVQLYGNSMRTEIDSVFQILSERIAALEHVVYGTPKPHALC